MWCRRLWQAAMGIASRSTVRMADFGWSKWQGRLVGGSARGLWRTERESVRCLVVGLEEGEERNGRAGSPLAMTGVGDGGLCREQCEQRSAPFHPDEPVSR